MDQLFPLDLLRNFTSLVLLSAGVVQDVRSREISDLVWALFAAAALPINLYGFLEGSVEPLSWLLFAGVQSALFILLYYAGSYGGADAKAFICLSIMYPTSIQGFLTDVSMGKMPVSLSSFANAIILSLVYLPANLAWNIAARLRGVGLFKGLEHENPLKKAAALLLLRKTTFSRCVSDPDRFLLAEKRSRRGVRRIILFSRLNEEVDERFDGEEYVFTSFLMPFQVFILLGLIVRLLYGDLLLSISTSIVKPIVTRP
ncbi:MAG: prepilin peptidase [Thermoproteota archaeon]